MRCLSRRTKTSIQLAVVESMVWVPTWWNLIVRQLERDIGEGLASWLYEDWCFSWLVGCCMLYGDLWRWVSTYRKRGQSEIWIMQHVSVAQISWDIHRFGKYRYLHSDIAWPRSAQTHSFQKIRSVGQVTHRLPTGIPVLTCGLPRLILCLIQT